MQSSYKTRLLAGAALGLGLSTLAPQQAMAACVVTATTVVCGPTSTLDSTYPTNAPNDRHYQIDTSAAGFTGTVSAGALVDNYGLAFINTVPGTNTINIVNDGAVQINAGNTASAGSTAALIATAGGSSALNYSGTGSVTNLGTIGDGLRFDMDGSGALTANVGGNVTSAAGGPGTATGIIVNNSGTGAVSLTTATGTTVRADYVGVWDFVTNPLNASTQTVTNNAAVASLVGAPGTLDYGVGISNDGIGATSVVNNGTVGSSTDRTVETAVFGAATNAASTAALSVTGTGALYSAGDGIEVFNAGSGTTTVNYTGPINTTGALGVDVDAAGGTTNVTLGAVTAATDAVDVNSTGTQSIILNGVTTGTAGSGLVSTTTAARTITVGSSGNVTGGTQAILIAGAGTTTLGNAGVIGAAASPGGLAINAAGAGATTVNNNASGTINGRLTLTANADTFGNQGTFNTQGITDFGAGADTFTNTGTMTLTGAATLANLETFNQSGQLNLGTFVLTGPAIALVNTGNIDTNGNAGLAGFTAFDNAGTLNLAAGVFTAPAGVLFTNSGTIFADEGVASITGQSSFANTGTIDLQDGVVDDILTINSDFAGSGNSTLLVDFNTTASDELIINGAASGTTTIDANFLGGGLINLGGVLVVDAVTATDDAFVLGTVTGDTPLVDFSLVQEGGDFLLVSAPTAAAFNPLVVPGFATDLWYQSANEVFAETVKPATTVGVSLWGNGYYSRDKWDNDGDDIVVDGVAFDVDYGRKTKRHGIQGGVDYGFPGARVGLTGGYGWAKADGSNDADLKAKGWNLGLYGQFGGITGFHGEVLVKHDRYDAEFDDGAFDGVDFDIRSTGFDGSLGYRMGMGTDGNIDLHGGVSHVRTKVDDIEAFGFTYDTGRLTSTRGRAGVRATFGGAYAPYIAGTVYHEFKGDGDIDLFDGAENFALDTRGKGTWGRLEAGLSGNDGPGPILAAWGELGDRKGLGLRAGWRIGGARVIDAAPPPPPPPPPVVEAPATQTCSDGSVILATDSCPLPPPPPPPPAPEPERG